MSPAAPSQPELTGGEGRVWNRPGGVRHRTQGKLRGRLKDIGCKSVADRTSAVLALRSSLLCPRATRTKPSAQV